MIFRTECTQKFMVKYVISFISYPFSYVDPSYQLCFGAETICTLNSLTCCYWPRGQ